MRRHNWTRLFVWILLLAGYLMCFSWGVSAYYAVFGVIVAYMYRTRYLFATSPILGKLIVFALLVNLITTANYCLLEDFDLNTSWFLQLSLVPFILCFTQYVVRYDFPHFQKACLLFLLCLCLPTALIAFLINWYSNPAGLSFLLTEGIITGEVYSFVRSAHVQLGLFKSTLPWLMCCLTILSSPLLTRRQSTLCFLCVLSYTFVTGSKSTLLGLAVVLCVYAVCRFRTRVALFLLLLCANVLILAANFDYFNEICLYDGRYFAPVFSSEGFWSRPLGIGYGNYVEGMRRGVFGENPFDTYACSWIHTEMDSMYDMYVVAESDVLGFSVSFGWVAFAVLVFLAIRIIAHNLSHYEQKNSLQKVGFYLFLFLIGSGLTQDYFNVPISWLFYGMSFTLMVDNPAVSRDASRTIPKTAPFQASCFPTIGTSPR
ncbi:MAG: hypothetical protein HQ567_35060 [Candidatus Nealsonbacteria bacterium]|nr:hypothetical protein [Candidatus Nealsonbacteria bacterium]